MTAKLFTPVEMGGVTLPNRIVVSPMCQYSAVDGSAQPWHMVHYGSLAMSGAGLLCFEATHVEREGRITRGCLGLYSDENEAALKPVVEWARAWTPHVKLGIQLGRGVSARDYLLALAECQEHRRAYAAATTGGGGSGVGRALTAPSVGVRRLACGGSSSTPPGRLAAGGCARSAAAGLVRLQHASCFFFVSMLQGVHGFYSKQWMATN